ncbi:MAG: HPP family protein [Pseudomonadota bacterium]
MLTRTVNPPAGSNPVIVFLTVPNWTFLLSPTVVGASVIVLIALIFNNTTRFDKYPIYW